MSGVQLAYIILFVLVLGFVGGIYAQKSVDEWNEKDKRNNE